MVSLLPDSRGVSGRERDVPNPGLDRTQDTDGLVTFRHLTWSFVFWDGRGTGTEPRGCPRRTLPNGSRPQGKRTRNPHGMGSRTRGGWGRVDISSFDRHGEGTNLWGHRRTAGVLLQDPRIRHKLRRGRSGRDPGDESGVFRRWKRSCEVSRVDETEPGRPGTYMEGRDGRWTVWV